MTNKKPPARLVDTEDGTRTIYMEDYDEAMHSSHGAYGESLIKHVEPSCLLEKKGPLTVFDIGFGMGYNILALLSCLKERAPGKEISIYSFELNNAWGDLLREVSFDDERDDIYALLRRAFEGEVVREGPWRVNVIFGDARQTIHDMADLGADAVFQDPFSPSRNPELWTVEFFTSLYKAMKEDAVLTTYSGALHVRGALLAAGFSIGRGPGMGKKREGTLAGKKTIFPPLTGGETRDILDNVKSTPYRDVTGKDAREEILQRRIDEMALRRSRVRAGHRAHR